MSVKDNPPPKPACARTERIASHHIGFPLSSLVGMGVAEYVLSPRNKFKFYSWRVATCAASLGEKDWPAQSIAALGFRPELLGEAGVTQKDQARQAAFEKIRDQPTLQNDGDEERGLRPARLESLLCSTFVPGGAMISCRRIDEMQRRQSHRRHRSAPSLWFRRQLEARDWMPCGPARRFECKRGFEGGRSGG
ncbi:uncharacterized protein Triagg1_1786 [Trichoderma aggressivum f. europaeum]|uniref:Uncharacterized protein n=1 Tax=Trichoderma aggressivum f. europaeum TaxID=173218 RepID=A0AAE1IJS2_9HYPO|nr:hypothetical protein Triagg1_1786 [Trichoderma aggressivum f. europaeum]